MTFQEVYPYFKNGLKIQRLSNVNSLAERIYINEERNSLAALPEIPIRDIMADDWMVIHSTFDVVINLLMLKKCRKIFRFKDKNNSEEHIHYFPNEQRLVKGLGTSHPCEYSFTKEDIVARDWCFVT